MKVTSCRSDSAQNARKILSWQSKSKQAEEEEIFQHLVTQQIGPLSLQHTDAELDDFLPAWHDKILMRNRCEKLCSKLSPKLRRIAVAACLRCFASAWHYKLLLLEKTMKNFRIHYLSLIVNIVMEIASMKEKMKVRGQSTSDVVDSFQIPIEPKGT